MKKQIYFTILFIGLKPATVLGFECFCPGLC